ncbi:hypothetical protein COV18_05650 [Candidatus Woesearchaeota archaeon CG10_big_fil_rev_8_21_14_0_10_37_12]|nr:MAG: hypothetical protein COV18_05650 [Candidatus Woesearchaeota archaeon CG10_big_fil_rev_8_21_14_0_10_37_12]
MAKGFTDVGEELKHLLVSGKLVLGTEKAVSLLRQGKLKKIFLASNCAEDVKKGVYALCELQKVECVDLFESNEDIGAKCKKPFAISVIGVTA